MKKFLMIAIVLMTTMQANAQNEEGAWSFMPKVGLGIADMTGQFIDEDDKGYPLKPIFSLVAGMEAEYAFNEQLAVAMGFNFSTQGAKANGMNNVELRVDYVNIPLMLQYYPIPGIGLALKAGAQLGITARKRMKVNGVRVNLDDVENRIKYLYGESSTFKGACFYIPLGISYELANFVLDARYNLGLTDVMKEDPEHSKHSVWQFTLGYKIDLGD